MPPPAPAETHRRREGHRQFGRAPRLIPIPCPAVVLRPWPFTGTAGDGELARARSHLEIEETRAHLAQRRRIMEETRGRWDVRRPGFPAGEDEWSARANALTEGGPDAGARRYQ